MSTIRRASIALSSIGVLAAAGCGASNQHAGAGGMGNAAGGGMSYSQPTCSAPAGLPGRVVTVTLADMGMTRMMGGTAPMDARMLLRSDPVTVTAGQVTLVGENLGWRTHELVVLPLAAGTPAGRRVPGSDGKVDETGSLGEASANCTAGTGDGIASGEVGWVTLTLSPGRYELVCNLTNHYADGMRQEFTVTT